MIARGQLPRLTAGERCEPEIARTLVFHREVDAAVILGPMHLRRRAIELAADHARAGAIAIHYREFGVGPRVVTLIESRIGDQLAVGRNHRIAIRSLAMRELTNVLRRHVDSVNLRLAPFVLPVLGAQTAEENLLTVGCPGNGVAVIVVAARELARCTAIGGHKENMPVSLFQESLAIGAIVY